MPVLSLPGVVDLLGIHRAASKNYPVLLETTTGNGWNILLAFPQQTQLFNSEQAGLFLNQLDAAWLTERCLADSASVHLPFRGGWFVYLGYEMLQGIEPGVQARPPDSDFPLAALMRVPAAILVDARRKMTWIFAETGHDSLLTTMADDCSKFGTMPDLSLRLSALFEQPAQAFLDGVDRIRRYIHEGDVFQVNLSRRWHGKIESVSPGSALYQVLRRGNPAPFAGLAQLTPQHSIISSSPERLVQVQAGRAHTRPIAGTYPRHSDRRQDEQTRAALAAHPKERAEHVMLVDLERNDLGRICEPGSVHVPELMAIASYAHVHHIESTVAGQLRKGVTPSQLIRALFPGGTITGCPKVRTMQIIRELETTPRHAYTGSMGYLNRDGDLDLNILIRSMMLVENEIRFSAGAGIVADSDPQRELNETRVKAKGLLRALGLDE